MPSSPGLLDPVFAFLFAVVAGVQPQVRKTREQFLRFLQKQLYPVAVEDVGRVNFAVITRPSVSTSSWRFLPLTFLPGS